MPKKQFFNRLDTFFSALEEREAPQPGEQVEVTLPVALTQAKSWSWECDAAGSFTACSPELFNTLGFTPDEWIGKSIYKTGIHPNSSAVLKKAIQGALFPVEIEALYCSKTNQWKSIRLSIFSTGKSNGHKPGFHGYGQVLADVDAPDFPITSPTPKTKAPRPQAPINTAPARRTTPSQIVGASTKAWSQAGQQSLNQLEPVIQTGDENSPAAIAMPLKMTDNSPSILEIVDDRPGRRWTEDERLLVQEITNQLGLAIENAQLFTAAQKELQERTRAEEEIRHRNEALAHLNNLGQHLTQLATRDEIFDLVTETLGKIYDISNLIIATYDEKKQLISFPRVFSLGQSIQIAPRPLANEIVDHVIRSQTPISPFTISVADLIEMNVTLPNPGPKSVLAMPIQSGNRIYGAIVFQNFVKFNAYTEMEAGLLSTICAQTFSALDNSNLFTEINSALLSLENRERYQSNVANAVATLSQSGTKALPEVLQSLGQASDTGYIYYAQIEEDESGAFWRLTAEWNNPAIEGRLDFTRTSHMLAALFPTWINQLRERGWYSGLTSEMPEQEREFLRSQGIRSSLILAVPGKRSIPSFIAFHQLDTDRVWQSEEIDSLRVAADAISNTFVREDLLEQVQATLDETENLYNASHRLALANDFKEMITALAGSIRSQDLNRSILILFEQDDRNHIKKMTVTANWYSGHGTPPAEIGSDFSMAASQKLFITQTPVFYDAITPERVGTAIAGELRDRNIQAMAVLPLWASKKQLGAVVLQSDVRHHFTGREIRSYPPLVDQMAIAVDNLRLFSQTQSALSETGLLYEISDGVSKATDAQSLVTLIGKEVIPSNCQRVSLISIARSMDGHFGELTVVGYYDQSGQYHFENVKVPAAAMPALSILTKEALVLSNTSSSDLDPVSKRTMASFEMASICSVPLYAGGNLIGLLTASSNKPSDFDPSEVHRFTVAASSVGVALERQQFLQTAQRRALELEAAAEIARDTASTLSLDSLLNQIVNQLKDRFNFYHVSVFLLDESKTWAVVRESTGEAGREMKARGHRLAVGSRSITGTVTSSGNPFVVNDVQASDNYYPNPLLPDTRSEIGIPLKLAENIIGSLDIQSTQVNAFTTDEIQVLQILADQIAVAIENARAYEIAQEAVEEMKEVDRVKTQFLANMSHELRTPLNSIIGFSRVILKGIDGPINDTQKQDLSAIYNSGQHLLSLINNILDLSKIEAGKMELNVTEINMTDIVNSVMSTAIGLVKDKTIKLFQDVPSDLPLIKADPTRIRQILLNLVSNASKFTDEGSISVVVRMSTEQTVNPELMITVTDTGVGILPEDQTKLFQPFSQVDDSPTRKTGGTGLGLSICRSLVEMHGGRIGVLSSEIGKGTTFFFTLPLEPVVIEPEVEDESSNLTILAVDDDAQVISLYERYLKPQGYEVVPCTNSSLAVAKAKAIHPVAITLDIMMPDKDGWQILHELKSDPATRNIPVLICSILEDEEKGINLGASDYLVKPFLQDDLVAAISRLDDGTGISNVLIIDDDPDDARLVEKMLQNSGKFNVTIAEGGQKGLTQMLANPPDAVVLDLFMPDLDGFAVLSAMHQSERLSTIPVLVLTGADLTPAHHQQMAEFGRELLTKSALRENELINTLQNSLRRIRGIKK
jgi:signal transduction histidine kinase/CheY-like chemotaxis protein